MTFVLDAGLVSRLVHPARAQYRPVARWMDGLLARGRDVIVLPEIVDYEVRRKLLHLVRRDQASTRSVARLDDLGQNLEYLPLTTAMMRRASELWAEARLQGVPTASADSLDADAILAAQALAVGGAVITTNPRHLGRYVPVRSWADIEAGMR